VKIFIIESNEEIFHVSALGKKLYDCYPGERTFLKGSKNA